MFKSKREELKEELNKHYPVYKIVPNEGVSNEEIREIYNKFIGIQTTYLEKTHRPKSLLAILITSLGGVLLNNSNEIKFSEMSHYRIGVRGMHRFGRLLLFDMVVILLTFKPTDSLSGALEI